MNIFLLFDLLKLIYSNSKLIQVHLTFNYCHIAQKYYLHFSYFLYKQTEFLNLNAPQIPNHLKTRNHNINSHFQITKKLLFEGYSSYPFMS